MKKIEEMTNEELQNALDVMSTMEEAKTTVEKIKTELNNREKQKALKAQEEEANLIASQKDILGRYFKNDGDVHFYYKVIGVVNEMAVVEAFTTNNRYYRKYTSCSAVSIEALKQCKEITKSEYDKMKEETICKLNCTSSIWDLFPTMF